MGIGGKIKSLRKQHNRSQEDLAQDLGVSRQTINKWETDKAQPNTENISKICAIFNVVSDYFLSASEDIEKTESAAVGSPTVVVVRDDRVTFTIWSIIVGVLFAIATVTTVVIAHTVFSPISGDEVIHTFAVDIYGFSVSLAVSILLLASEVVLIVFAVKTRKKKKA